MLMIRCTLLSEQMRSKVALINIRTHATFEHFNLDGQVQYVPPPPKKKIKVPLIIDTDASFDVDDVLAICMAHALERRGEAKILAVMHDAGIPEGRSMVRTLLKWDILSS